MRRIMIMAAACAALLVLGCLEFDEQHVYVEHDQEGDRLILVVDYEGIYAEQAEDGGLPMGQMKEATEQLAEAIETQTVAFGDNWPFALPMVEIRESLEDPDKDVPPDVLADARWLADHVTVLKAGFYTDVPGRLCGAQVVVIEPFAEVVTRANRLANAFTLFSAEEDPDDVHLQRMAAAARQGHEWLRVDGHGLVVSVPIDEAAVREVRLELAGGAVEEEDISPLRHALALLLANPVYVWHADGVLRVKLGMAAEPSTLVTRTAYDDYDDNLVGHVRETYGLELDSLLARYLLEPDAAALVEAVAQTEAERAARIMAARLAQEGRVRVLLHQLATDPSEPYREMLRAEAAAIDGPMPTDPTDKWLIEFWQKRLGADPDEVMPPLVTE